MANNASNLNISSLDFDTIKSNLIAYLRGQDQFKDYDFEGSGLSVIMDLLAYNTHYQAFYANMVANESFLDSAAMRSSVISLAKHLNYIPKSTKAARAYVNVELFPTDQATKDQITSGTKYVLAGDRFAVNIGSRAFVFTAITDTQVRYDGRYLAKNIEIREGETRTDTYVFNTNQNTDQKFVISDRAVDTDTITVRVSKSIGDATGVDELWMPVTDINLQTPESLVYFLQQNAEGYYEVYFGDNIVGKKPDPGNVINIGYNTSVGSEANGIGKNETDSLLTFRYSNGVASKTTLLRDSQNKPIATFGGSDPETIQSIKYYAPRHYQAQERAVTADDYRVLIARQYGDQAESVFVWGGEDNDPPVYGKVFVSIKPTNATKLTTLQKLAITKNILKTKNVISVIPEIVDPDYLYLILNVAIKYDSDKTTLLPAALASKIRDLLYTYSQTNVGKFDGDFVRSNFTTYINTTFNPPVLSNTLDLLLQKRLEPNLSAITTYAINFDNILYHPIDGYSSILSSTSFGYQDSTSTATVKPNVDAYLDDDGSGTIRIYKAVGGTKIYLSSDIGSIDYTTGKVNLVNFAPQYMGVDSPNSIKITVKPADQIDILTRRNQILIVELANINVVTSPQTLRYDPYSASAASFNGTN